MMTRPRNNLFPAAIFLVCLFVPMSFAQSQRTSTPPQPPRPEVTTATRPGIKVDVKGNFEGQAYTNRALGFALNLPPGWQAQDIETQRQFAEKASERAGEVMNGNAAAQASVSRTTLLFIVIRPTEGRANPVIMGIAEDIALVFSIRTPRQYLMSARAFGDKSPLLFDDQITNEKINGVEFGWLGAVPRDPNSGAKQRYYVTLRHNHAIAFVLTYFDDKQLQSCLEVINSIKFE